MSVQRAEYDKPALSVLYRAEVVETDYPFDRPGKQVWIATCACGWYVTRQLRSAAESQLVRHHRDVHPVAS